MKGLKTVRFIRYTPGGRHVWLEEVDSDGRPTGFRYKKPASVMLTPAEREAIQKAQDEKNDQEDNQFQG